MSCVRGDIHRLRVPREAPRHRGSEQRAARYAVIVQSDDLLLATILVAPTSRSATPRILRPPIGTGETPAQVLTEQTAAVTPERLGELVGRVSLVELQDIAAAIRLTRGLD